VRRDECTPEAAKKAMAFLTDEWLVDVATDYNGKCVLIAIALTLIERVMLPERPVFFVVAGRRGTGKTTVLYMLIKAVTGIAPAAAAWSPNEEERRKSLLGYLLSGVPYILWDNIPRGTTISCPHIERACTAPTHTDRVLGTNNTPTADATTVQLFTGNNVGPRGDMTSRSLVARLDVERSDPENRDFKHPDPVGWTEAHRGEILQALYTVLLANPVLGAAEVEAKTRFKTWWRIVGSAVEHAAAESVDFGKMFRSQEEEDLDDINLVDALAAMNYLWVGRTFYATDVHQALESNEQGIAHATLREFFSPELGKQASVKSIARTLASHIGEPVTRGGVTFVLKKYKAGHDNKLKYSVVKRGEGGSENDGEPDTRAVA
jgi:hypothetical protein